MNLARGRDWCWRRGVAAGTALLAFASTPAGAAFDFIWHNGMDACWSTSKNAATMSVLIVDLVEGAPACIPANEQGSPAYCYTSMCSGGQAGCPTVLHGKTSLYVEGASRFDTIGGLDSVSGKLTVFGTECDFSVDTTNAALEFPVNYSVLPEYGLIPDGNNGYYLTQVTVGDVAVNGLTAADVSLSGNILCSTINIGNVFDSILATVRPSIESAVQPSLDYAWCPWPF